MKKVFYLIALSAAAMLAGCSKENSSDVTTPSGKQITIYASLEGTKTTHSTGAFAWTDGEKISVAGYEYMEYVDFTCSDTEAGAFTGDESVPLIAVSPVQDNSLSFTDESEFQVALPETYTYAEGVTNALLIGELVSDDPYTFKFRNAAALLKITYENVPVGTTGLSLTASHNITGTVTLSGTDGESIEIKNTNEELDGNTVTINLPVATTALSDLTFYVPVPSGTYTSFVAKLNNSNEAIEASTVKTVEGNLEVIRGEVITLPTVTLAAGFVPVVVGSTDNSVVWGDNVHGDPYFIEPGQTLHLDFVNYTRGEENYQNWVFFFANSAFGSDGYSEYFVLRADNYGWGDVNYSASNLSSWYDWSAIKTAMNGANVSATIERTSAGSIQVYVKSVSADGNYIFWEKYTHPVPVTGDVCTFLWCDGAHFEVNKVWYTGCSKTFESLSSSYNYYLYDAALDLSVIGGPKKSVLANYSDGSVGAVLASNVTFDSGTTLSASAGEQTVDCYYNGEATTITIPVTLGVGAYGSTTLATDALSYSPFFGDVPVNSSVTKKLYVYSSCVNNYASPCVDVASAGFGKFYMTGRMDNYGWGVYYSSVTPTSDWNWDKYQAYQNHASVDITFTNNSTTGTVRYDVTWWDGETHYQQYSNITLDNSEMAYRSFTENSYVVVLE